MKRRQRQRKRARSGRVPVAELQMVSEWAGTVSAVDHDVVPQLRNLVRLLEAVLQPHDQKVARQILNKAFERKTGGLQLAIFDAPTMQEAETWCRVLLRNELQELCIFHVALEPSHVAQLVIGLQGNKSLSDVSLSSLATISEEGGRQLAEALSSIPSLRHLCFEVTRTETSTFAIVKLLQRNPHLLSLSLKGDISPDACEALCKAASNLWKLRLGGLWVKLVVQPFADLVERSTRLCHLSLRAEFEDADAVVLARVLRRNGTLRHLNLSYAKFTLEGMMALILALEEDNFTLTDLVHSFENPPEVVLRMYTVLVRNGNIQWAIQKALLCCILCESRVRLKWRIPKDIWMHIFLLMRVQGRAWHERGVAPIQ